MELTPDGHQANYFNDKLIVDGANGVGGDKLELLIDLCGGLLTEVRNSSKGEGVLNEGVGADFVQKEKVMPSGFEPSDAGLRLVDSFLILVPMIWSSILFSLGQAKYTCYKVTKLIFLAKHKVSFNDEMQFYNLQVLCGKRLCFCMMSNK